MLAFLNRQLHFQSANDPAWLIAWLVIVGAAIALIVLLYRYERHLVPRKVGNWLLVLRLSLALLVLLTALQPVLSWTLYRQQHGEIQIAMDVSESMATIDEHADDAEKLRWARALGLVGNSRIDARLDRWIEALQQQRQPDFTDDSDPADEQQREELSTAREVQLRSILESVDRLSRKQIAAGLLTESPADVLKRLQNVGNVTISAFAGQDEPVQPDSLAQLVEQTPADLLPEISDIGRILLEATAVVEQTPLLGVVIFTDGRDNSDQDLLPLAQRLRELSVPVFPVVIGSHNVPRDLSIAHIDAPQQVFHNDQAMVKAAVNTSGYEGQNLTVTLEHFGEQIDEKTITAAANMTQVEFALPTADIGRQKLTLRMEALPDETRDDNNVREFSLNVISDKVEVVLLDGAPRWEFRYLFNAFSRDSRVNLRTVLFEQPYLGVLPDTFFPRKLKLPANPDDFARSPFAGSDLVIVGDVSPRDVDADVWKLLERFVAEEGGTLVLTAGQRYFPLHHRLPIVEQLLPITNRQVWHLDDPLTSADPSAAGFHLQLTPDGEKETFLQFAANAKENERIWSELPGHFWGIQGEAKPGATVLATAFRSGRAVTLEDERTRPIIVHQHYGLGQVLWLGIDSTWRWRLRTGDLYHHKFWGQLGRWAANNKAGAGNEFVKFGPESPEISVGDDVLVRARWMPDFLQRHPEVAASVQVDRLEADNQPVPFSQIDLHPVPNQPLLREAPLVALPAGEYRLRLQTKGGELGSREVVAPLYVRPKTTLELSQLTPDFDLLTQLANVTGGRVFTPDEIDQLPEQFLSPELTAQSREDIELWDHAGLLCLMLALLTIEWVTRKLHGLP